MKEIYKNENEELGYWEHTRIKRLKFVQYAHNRFTHNAFKACAYFNLSFKKI